MYKLGNLDFHTNGPHLFLRPCSSDFIMSRLLFIRTTLISELFDAPSINSSLRSHILFIYTFDKFLTAYRSTLSASLDCLRESAICPVS